ncbi:SEP domain protein [Ancylostoma caninum]|uniref:SEP domain protein n=1 Tax=Ancylostoma caninum TaxID=29170 RepID=A0A368H5B7_ANCCA|nr:SEP domain protein [Ancylostoma caninum]
MSKRFATLASLRKEEHDSGEESDGGGERQGFFVGGSEHSGQQVLGPERPSRDSPNMVERVFDAARQHGAEALTSNDVSSQHHHRTHFGGGGVRLGDPSLGPQLPASDSSSGGSDNEPDEVVVELFMWENGFSIDDGPLRTFDQPESRQFLESIMQGRVPDELLAAHPRRRIDLRMQRRSGPYEPPKLKPFQGAGVRLGAVVPQVVSSAAPSSSSPAAQDSENNLDKAQAGVELDNNSPVTQSVSGHGRHCFSANDNLSE